MQSFWNTSSTTLFFRKSLSKRDQLHHHRHWLIIFLLTAKYFAVSGNLATSISYLLPQFIIIENFKELYETNKGKFSNRNFKKLNEKYFNVELKCIDWFLATKNNNLDFRTFFHVFNKTLDKHVPRKQGMRKVKKLEVKPWVTKGIKTFMKLRDKLYKEA